MTKFRHRLTLNRYGCHGRVWPELRKGESLSDELCADALRSAGFRVDRLLLHENGVVGLRWPVRSLGDLHGATRMRKDRWRVKIPAARRGRFILQCLKRRRIWERQGWHGFFVEFKTYRKFRSSGMTWALYSAHYFALREGFYWVISLAPIVGPMKYRSLLRTGYLDRVAKDLRPMGFRVLIHGNYGLAIDQDFLPSAELLRKSRQLLQWRPTKIGPSP